MKTNETKFELVTAEDGVRVSYSCLYIHPDAKSRTADITLPDQTGGQQCGSVNQPEWSAAGNLYLRGELTERDDVVSTRQFPDESAACAELWKAFYLLLEFERRVLKYEFVPATAPDHITTLILNGRVLRLTDDGLRELMKALR